MAPTTQALTTFLVNCDPGKSRVLGCAPSPLAHERLSFWYPTAKVCDFPKQDHEPHRFSPIEHNPLPRLLLEERWCRAADDEYRRQLGREPETLCLRQPLPALPTESAVAFVALPEVRRLGRELLLRCSEGDTSQVHEALHQLRSLVDTTAASDASWPRVDAAVFAELLTQHLSDCECFMPDPVSQTRALDPHRPVFNEELEWCSSTFLPRLGENALHRAAKHGHLAVVRLLVDEVGIDLHWKSTEGKKHPIYLAAASGHLAVVEYLLQASLLHEPDDEEDDEDDEAKQDSDSDDENLAASADHFLDESKRARIDQPDPSFRAMIFESLVVAAGGGHSSVVQALLATHDTHKRLLQHASLWDLVSCVNWQSDPPLIAAARGCHVATMQAILAAASDCDRDLPPHESGTPFAELVLSQRGSRGYGVLASGLLYMPHLEPQWGRSSTPLVTSPDDDFVFRQHQPAYHSRVLAFYTWATKELGQRMRHSELITVFNLAVVAGNVELVQRLVAEQHQLIPGAPQVPLSINLVKDQGTYCLAFAVHTHDLPMVKLFVEEYRVDFLRPRSTVISSKTRRTLGPTNALAIAVHRGHMDVALYLFNCVAEWQRACEEQPLAEYPCPKYGLLAPHLYGCEAEMLPRLKARFMQIAAAAGRADVVERLLELGTDIQMGYRVRWVARTEPGDPLIKSAVESLDAEDPTCETRRPLLTHLISRSTVQSLIFFFTVSSPPLTVAAAFGCRTVAERLFAHHLELAQQSRRADDTSFFAALTYPFMVACMYGYKSVAESCLALEPRLIHAISGDEHLTPACLAAVGGHLDVLQALLDAGCDLGAPCGNGSSPILLAAANGHLSTMNWLATHAHSLADAHALADAAAERHEASSTKHLHSQYTSAKLRGEKRALLDEQLSACDTVGGARELLEDRHNRTCRSVLDLTLINFCHTVPRLWSTRGQQFAGLSMPEWASVEPARRREMIASVVDALLGAGADVNACFDGGHTPLMLALMAGNDDLAYVLLERGADVTMVRPINEVGVMHFAAVGGSVELVRLLIDRGLEPCKLDAHRHPPLIYALQNNRLHVAEELLRLGAGSPGQPTASEALSEILVDLLAAGYVHACVWLLSNVPGDWAKVLADIRIRATQERLDVLQLLISRLSGSRLALEVSLDLPTMVWQLGRLERPSSVRTNCGISAWRGFDFGHGLPELKLPRLALLLAMSRTPKSFVSTFHEVLRFLPKPMTVCTAERLKPLKPRRFAWHDICTMRVGDDNMFEHAIRTNQPHLFAWLAQQTDDDALLSTLSHARAKRATTVKIVAPLQSIFRHAISAGTQLQTLEWLCTVAGQRDCITATALFVQSGQYLYNFGQAPMLDGAAQWCPVDARAIARFVLYQPMMDKLHPRALFVPSSGGQNTFHRLVMHHDLATLQLFVERALIAGAQSAPGALEDVVHEPVTLHEVCTTCNAQGMTLFEHAAAVGNVVAMDWMLRNGVAHVSCYPAPASEHILSPHAPLIQQYADLSKADDEEDGKEDEVSDDEAAPKSQQPITRPHPYSDWELRAADPDSCNSRADEALEGVLGPRWRYAEMGSTFDRALSAACTTGALTTISWLYTGLGARLDRVHHVGKDRLTIVEPPFPKSPGGPSWTVVLNHMRANYELFSCSTPLSLAARSGSLEAVRWIVETYAAEYEQFHGRNVLPAGTVFARRPRVNVAQFIDLRGEDNACALMWAAYLSQFDIFLYLLEQGAGTHDPTVMEDTFLVCLERGAKRMTQLLLSDPDRRRVLLNESETTVRALTAATPPTSPYLVSIGSMTSTYEILLELAPQEFHSSLTSTESRAVQIREIFAIAIARGNEHLVNFLLSFVPDICNSWEPLVGTAGKRGTYYYTPLMLAAMKGMTWMCLLIMQSFAAELAAGRVHDRNVKNPPRTLEEYVNWADFAGRTALHFACISKVTTCVRLLLRYGARPDVVNAASLQTPVHVAATTGVVCILQHLLDAAADRLNNDAPGDQAQPGPVPDGYAHFDPQVMFQALAAEPAADELPIVEDAEIVELGAHVEPDAEHARQGSDASGIEWGSATQQAQWIEMDAVGGEGDPGDNAAPAAAADEPEQPNDAAPTPDELALTDDRSAVDLLGMRTPHTSSSALLQTLDVDANTPLLLALRNSNVSAVQLLLSYGATACPAVKQQQQPPTDQTKAERVTAARRSVADRALADQFKNDVTLLMMEYLEHSQLHLAALMSREWFRIVGEPEPQQLEEVPTCLDFTHTVERSMTTALSRSTSSTSPSVVQQTRQLHANSIFLAATTRNELDLLRWLLQVQAQLQPLSGVSVEQLVNQPGFRGVTALMLAAHLGSSGLVDLLLEHGADVNVVADSFVANPKSPRKNNAANCCETALLLGTISGEPSVVARLLAHGADLSVKDSMGHSPLFLATAHLHQACAELLWQAQLERDIAAAPPTTYIGTGATKIERGFIIAAAHGRLSMCQWLYDTFRPRLDQFNTTSRSRSVTLRAAKAAVHKRSYDDFKTLTNSTALGHAAASGHLHMVQWLIETRRAEIEAHNDAEASNSWPSEVQLLVDRQLHFEALVDFIDAYDGNGFTALLRTFDGDNGLAVAQYLVDMGADVNRGHEYTARTPLHFAVELDSVSMVDFLLAHGADPNAQDREGHTPLSAAILSAGLVCARLLLAHNALLPFQIRDAWLAENETLQIGIEEVHIPQDSPTATAGITLQDLMHPLLNIGPAGPIPTTPRPAELDMPSMPTEAASVVLGLDALLTSPAGGPAVASATEGADADDEAADAEAAPAPAAAASLLGQQASQPEPSAPRPRAASTSPPADRESQPEPSASRPRAGSVTPPSFSQRGPSAPRPRLAFVSRERQPEPSAPRPRPRAGSVTPPSPSQPEPRAAHPRAASASLPPDRESQPEPSAPRPRAGSVTPPSLPTDPSAARPRPTSSNPPAEDGTDTETDTPPAPRPRAGSVTPPALPTASAASMPEPSAPRTASSRPPPMLMSLPRRVRADYMRGLMSMPLGEDHRQGMAAPPGLNMQRFHRRRARPRVLTMRQSPKQSDSASGDLDWIDATGFSVLSGCTLRTVTSASIVHRMSAPRRRRSAKHPRESGFLPPKRRTSSKKRPRRRAKMAALDTSFKFDQAGEQKVLLLSDYFMSAARRGRVDLLTLLHDFYQPDFNARATAEFASDALATMGPVTDARRKSKSRDRSQDRCSQGLMFMQAAVAAHSNGWSLYAIEWLRARMAEQHELAVQRTLTQSRNNDDDEVEVMMPLETPIAKQLYDGRNSVLALASDAGDVPLVQWLLQRPELAEWMENNRVDMNESFLLSPTSRSASGSENTADHANAMHPVPESLHRAIEALSWRNVHAHLVRLRPLVPALNLLEVLSQSLSSRHTLARANKTSAADMPRFMAHAAPSIGISFWWVYLNSLARRGNVTLLRLAIQQIVRRHRRWQMPDSLWHELAPNDVQPALAQVLEDGPVTLPCSLINSAGEAGSVYYVHDRTANCGAVLFELLRLGLRPAALPLDVDRGSIVAQLLSMQMPRALAASRDKAKEPPVMPRAPSLCHDTNFQVVGMLLEACLRDAPDRELALRSVTGDSPTSSVNLSVAFMQDIQLGKLLLSVGAASDSVQRQCAFLFSCAPPNSSRRMPWVPSSPGRSERAPLLHLTQMYQLLHPDIGAVLSAGRLVSHAGSGAHHMALSSRSVLRHGVCLAAAAWALSLTTVRWLLQQHRREVITRYGLTSSDPDRDNILARETAVFVNQVDEHGVAPIVYACLRANDPMLAVSTQVEVVRLLLEHGATIDNTAVASFPNNHPLHGIRGVKCIPNLLSLTAALTMSTPLCELLYEHGARFSLASSLVPLSTAVEEESTAEERASASAALSAVCHNDRGVQAYGVTHSSADIVHWLVDHGADPHHRIVLSDPASSCVFLAAFVGNSEFVEALLDRTSLEELAETEPVAINWAMSEAECSDYCAYFRVLTRDLPSPTLSAADVRVLLRVFTVSKRAAHLFRLCDVSGTGELDQREFCMLMRLLRMLRTGIVVSLPATLPDELWQSYSTPPPRMMLFAGAAVNWSAAASVLGSEHAARVEGIFSLESITPAECEQYQAFFREVCSTASEARLSSAVAHAYFASMGSATPLTEPASEAQPAALPRSLLSHMWRLADRDRDGLLDAHEFAVAFHVCMHLLRMGATTLPEQLPEAFYASAPPREQAGDADPADQDSEIKELAPEVEGPDDEVPRVSSVLRAATMMKAREVAHGAEQHRATDRSPLSMEPSSSDASARIPRGQVIRSNLVAATAGAAHRGHVGTAALLLERGHMLCPDTADQLEQLKAALLPSCVNGHVDIVRLCLSMPLLSNTPELLETIAVEPSLNTPLHAACHHGHWNVAELLLRWSQYRIIFAENAVGQSVYDVADPPIRERLDTVFHNQLVPRLRDSCPLIDELIDIVLDYTTLAS